MAEGAADPIPAALARGDATSRVLVAHRDAIIHHLAAILLIGGESGVRACAAGAAEAVIAAHRKQKGGRT